MNYLCDSCGAKAVTNGCAKPLSQVHGPMGIRYFATLCDGCEQPESCARHDVDMERFRLLSEKREAVARIPHQERVVTEKAELDEKREKLHAFIDSSPIYKALPEEDRLRLTRQASAMGTYSDILGERIAAF